MDAAGWFQEAPFWVVMLILFIAMALAREFGARVRRRVRAPQDGDEGGGDEGYIVSGVLGLLALLLAFSFGVALNRYEARRELVVTEANALGTASLRTAVLDEPGKLRSLMHAYAQARLTYGQKSGAEQLAAEAQADKLQPQIWSEAVRLVGARRDTAMAGFVLAPLNEAFDTASARKAALAARLPDSVLATLVIYFVAAAAVLGYAVHGPGGGHRLASLAVFALFVLALGLILDLDRPRDGLIRIPQAAMVDAVKGLGS